MSDTSLAVEEGDVIETTRKQLIVWRGVNASGLRPATELDVAVRFRVLQTNAAKGTCSIEQIAEGADKGRIADDCCMDVMGGLFKHVGACRTWCCARVPCMKGSCPGLRHRRKREAVAEDNKTWQTDAHARRRNALSQIRGDLAPELRAERLWACGLVRTR